MGDEDRAELEPKREYALSGKLMLSAVVALFAVVVFLACLHLYSRWYFLRIRRRIERRRERRRVSRRQIVLYLDNWLPPAAAADRGLDKDILTSLPVSLHSTEPDEEAAPAECAVCLSEFEDREIVRLLPNCGHSFHIECIDMWFHSHSTCPLCRSPVEPIICRRPEPEEKADAPKPVFTSGSQTGNMDDTTTSLGGRRKENGPPGVRIAVPPRAELVTESAHSSPAGRLLSLRRIFSIGKKSPTTPPSGSETTELDLESGLSESSSGSNRVHTSS